MKNKSIFSTGLLLSMAVGLFLCMIGPSDLSALDKDHKGHRDYNSAYEEGERNGYDRGFEHGVRDKRNGDDFNFRHSREYQRGDVGWDSSMGKKKDYIRGFRAGYEAGYNDGYYDRRSRSEGGYRRSDDRDRGIFGDRGRDRDRDRDKNRRGFGRYGDDEERDRFQRRGSGGPFGGAQFVWRGRVDGKDYIKISGNRVWIEHKSKKPITEDRYDIRSPLPREEVNVRLNKIRGRDRVEIIEQPRAQNNYTVTVMVEDRPAGSDYYEFELYW